jgi:lipopolysaccharide biosynthesis glycosyltransferase
MKVFIGYDPREAEIFHVCVQSILMNTKSLVQIIPLNLEQLKPIYKELHCDNSNSFVYSRFLVPYLCNFTGSAIYMDGDMVVRGDLSELSALNNRKYAVNVVKHDYKTKQTIKYMNQVNEDFPRKNWSSLMIWNCDHDKNKILQPDLISKATGKFLHRFEWLDDKEINELPKTWNWLCDEYGENKKAKLIHYTLGAPCFKKFKNTPMASEYNKYLKAAERVDDV